MAVGAQKDAFSRFGAQSLKRQSDALSTERKPLLRGIDMMELQSTSLPVIAADDASSPGLLDQELLQPAPMLRHRLGATAATAEIAAPLANEVCVAVQPARHSEPLDRRLG